MRILGVLAFGTVLSVAACSSSSGAPAGSGGAGGSSGTGGGTASLPAQAALKINLGPPALQLGTTCPALMSYEVGASGPSETNPGTGLVDGVNGTQVTCSVTGTGTGPFQFSASIHAVTTTGEPITFSFSNGTLDITDNGSASVSVFTPQLAATLSSAMPCRVVIIDEQVKAGSAWGEFACADITSPPSSDCSINGYFTLENCAGR